MPETVRVDPSASIGGAFAAAPAAEDLDRIGDLLHPEIDFRGLTPRREWEASDPDTVLGTVRSPEGLFRVEQQVCVGERHGRIGWMRVLCSGYRPIEG